MEVYTMPKPPPAHALSGDCGPRRSRKNIVRLCRAIAKLAEGPGEIDDLVHEVCDTLAVLEMLMHDAHERALEQQALADAWHERVREQVEEIPRIAMKQALIDYYNDNPDELKNLAVEIPEDWTGLEDVK